MSDQSKANEANTCGEAKPEEIMTKDQVDAIRKMPADQRLNFFFNQVRERQQIWILTDEHGAVMLTTEDEDCIPVWPNQALAQSWATGDWQGFEPKAISLADWRKKWTTGLEDDEIAIAVLPMSEDDGLILDPAELDYELGVNK